MVITTENVPFSLSIGLDLTYNEDYNYDNALTYINALQQFNIDYIVSPISTKNQELRRNVFKMEKTLNNSELKKPDNIGFDKPIFVNDLQMKFFFWKNKFISKIHDIDLEDIPKNFGIITQDLNYANYINSKSSILEIDLEKIFIPEKPNLNGNCTENPKDNQNMLINNVATEEFNKSRLQYEFYLVKLIKQFFTENIGRHLSMTLEFTKENYYFYTKLQSQINNVDNFEVLLKIDEDLPDEETLKLWCSQNIRALVIPFSLFSFNNHGFPVLRKKHQEYIKHFMRYGIDIILRDDKNFTSLETLDDLEDYTLYIKHLFVNHFDYKDHHYVLNDYLDVFQIPLQPLKDNLQSQTYECFEDDVAKYDLYEKALYSAFINYKETGHLQIHKVKEFWNSSDVNKKEMKNGKILNVCLVGAGRGPLMRRIVNAAIDAGLTINPILVEKNKNAFNTLLHLKKTEPHIFSEVKMLFGDMRNLNIDYKFDIIVSELLGSFGDNELSPECLADVEKCYLDPNGVMIPYSYSSFVRPVVYPVLWNNVKKLKSNYEFPFLVLFHKAYFPDETLKKVFEFTHPMEKEDPFNMEKSITFTFNDNFIIHGVSGYFDSVLYGDVKMSILPKEKSENMHYSWFPIFFPSLEPIEIRKDDVLQMNIERINNGKRVWYQWNFFKYNKNNAEIKAYPIQNLFGESYTINL